MRLPKKETRLGVRNKDTVQVDMELVTFAECREARAENAPYRVKH